MKRAALLFCLLLAACGEPGPHFINCTEAQEQDGRRALKVALKYYPLARATFEHMRISCELFDPYPESECVTWAYPTNTADGLAEFRIDLVGECLIHEADHYELRTIGIKDGCQSHTLDCGWDSVEQDDCLDEFAALDK